MTCIIVDFSVLADHWVKLKERETKDNYLESSKKIFFKLWNMKVTMIPIVSSDLSTVTKALLQGQENLELGGRFDDHPNYSIIEIGQNTEKSLGDLRRLAVTQTPVRIHQLTLVLTTRKETRSVELTAGERNLAEAKIQRGIFPGDALSSLLFIIVMMSLNHLLRKYAAGEKLSKSQENINHLMCMDNIKPFAKNEKEQEALIHADRIYSQDIGIEYGIERCAVLIMKSGEQYLTEFTYFVYTTRHTSIYNIFK